MSASASPHPPPAAEADPLIGRTVTDRSSIVEAIGQGGMGRVYKALQSPVDRVVALKILGAGHDRDPNFYKRFFLEASVTAKLTHPNTITLYDYGRTEDGIFFIAMEYLNGRTLSAAMQQDGPLAQERVIHIAQQICRSLREAHALDIILKHLHEKPIPPRELKPELKIAPEFEDLILKCMMKSRDDRFQSMDEMLAQLKSVRTTVTGLAGPSSLPPSYAADTSPNLRPISPALAAQTPPHAQPGMRTPSQPMPMLRTPAGGSPHFARPPPPPPEAMFDDDLPIQQRGTPAYGTPAAPMKGARSSLKPALLGGGAVLIP